MQVALEHREKLSLYCLVRKVTQEKAVNELLGEALARLDGDPELTARMDRAKELQRMMDELSQPAKANAATAQ